MGQGHTNCCLVPSKSYDLSTCKVWSCYVQQFRRRCIYKKVYEGQGHTKCCPVPSKSCDLCTYRVWSYYVNSFRKRSIYKKIQYLTFDRDLEVKVTQNVAQYPPHHVTYPATKFEVARSNRKGGDTFTRKYIIWSLTLTLGSKSHKTLPSILYIIWPFQLQSLKLIRQKV